MANRWVEFVKKYANENNISYTCAMCEIKTKGLYKPLEKQEKKGNTKTIKIKKQKAKKEIEYEDEDEEEEEKVIEKTKEEKENEAIDKQDNPDILTHMLQQAVLSTRDEVIVKALVNLNYRGRLQSNKFLMVRQIIQNFNTMEKLRMIIKEILKVERDFYKK